MINMLKDNLSTEQAAENVLRSYLIRCFSKVSKQYPPVSSMNPEDGVEELLKLRRNKWRNGIQSPAIANKMLMANRF